MSDTIQLTPDLKARIISDPARGPLVLELEEREEAGLGGYRFSRTYVPGREALAALAGLLQGVLTTTPADSERPPP